MKPTLELEVAGERLVVRGDRTLYWPAAATLFVADLHLGKGATFRAGGLPVPAGSTEATLTALGAAVRASGARSVVVLGDLWHAKAGRTEENRTLLQAWREAHDVEMTLVLGNHDRHAGWELDAVAPGRVVGPFALHHFPEEDANGYTLCGHLHPGVQLTGFGGDSLRLPCFWFGGRVGVLPAFGDLTGTAAIRPRSGDRVMGVADGLVVLVPTRDRFASRRR